MTSYKWNFWNYGICQDILKEQCPRGLLAKNEHFGANCLWDRSPVMLRKLHTNPSKFFLGQPQISDYCPSRLGAKICTLVVLSLPFINKKYKQCNTIITRLTNQASLSRFQTNLHCQYGILRDESQMSLLQNVHGGKEQREMAVYFTG